MINISSEDSSYVTQQSATISWNNRLRNLCRCGGKRRTNPRRSCCLNRDIPDIKRPDLAIYSQVEEIQKGNQPSWDSPDITTNDWRPFQLKEEAIVVVRNLSTEIGATNVLVHYYTAPFGIGTRRQLKQTRKVNILQNSAVELLFPLDKETLGGDQRVGVHIHIEHPHDEKIINNRGSQVHDGSYTTEVGRVHSIRFPVVNETAFRRTINLNILPTDIIASVNPTTHTFDPFTEITATLSIEIPGILVGTPESVINRSVTVTAITSSGELIGGVTKLLRIDN